MESLSENGGNSSYVELVAIIGIVALVFWLKNFRTHSKPIQGLNHTNLRFADAPSYKLPGTSETEREPNQLDWKGIRIDETTTSQMDYDNAYELQPFLLSASNTANMETSEVECFKGLLAERLDQPTPGVRKWRNTQEQIDEYVLEQDVTADKSQRFVQTAKAEPEKDSSHLPEDLVKGIQGSTEQLERKSLNPKNNSTDDHSTEIEPTVQRLDYSQECDGQGTPLQEADLPMWEWFEKSDFVKSLREKVLEALSPYSLSGREKRMVERMFSLPFLRSYVRDDGGILSENIQEVIACGIQQMVLDHRNGEVKEDEQLGVFFIDHMQRLKDALERQFPL